MDIFVSYTLKDHVLNPHRLRYVGSALTRLGAPYIDVLHNRSENPQEYVISMLEQTSIMCVCITPKLLTSKWVQFELGTALNRGIPIYGFDPTRMQFVNASRPISDLLIHQAPMGMSLLSTRW